MNQNPIAQRIYFRNLDVLRFIAAYMVVILHCFFGWKAHFGKLYGSEKLSQAGISKYESVIDNLSFGVDIFFLISGFLITYLLLMEHQKTGKVDVWKFYIRRAFRIWPLYFFMLLVGPLLTYFYGEQSPGYLYHFLFAGNFDILLNGTKSVATDHLWSIGIEEHFYLVCPLLVAFVPVKRLPQVLLGLVAVSILYRGLTALFVQNYGGAIYVHTLSRMDTLAIGSLLGYLFFNGQLSFNHSLPVRLTVYAIALFVFFNSRVVDSAGFFDATAKKYFFVFCAAYWMGNFLFHPNAMCAVKKPNIFHHFGKVSYGIYMFNPVIIYILLNIFSKYALSNYFLFLGLVHAALALACYLSYRYFEMPFLALKEKYAVVKSGAVITAPPGALAVQLQPVSEKENT